MIGITVLVETIWRHKREGGQERRGATPTCLPLISSRPPFRLYSSRLARLARAPKNCMGLGKGARDVKGLRQPQLEK